LDSSDNGSQIIFDVTVDSGNTLTIKQWAYVEGKAVEEAIQVAGPTDLNTTFNLTGSKLRSWTYSMTGNDPVSGVHLTFVTSHTTFWAHKPSPFFLANADNMKSYVMPAFASLISNESPDIQKQGEICCLQAPKSTLWFNHMSYKDISSMQGVVNMPAKTGIYAYAKMTDANDYSMKQNFRSNNGTLEYAWYNVDGPETSSPLVFALTAGAEVAAHNFVAEASIGFCFETIDVFFIVAPPSALEDAYKKAIQAMTGSQQVFENPNHLKGAISWIKNKIKTFGPSIIEKSLPYVIKGIENL